MKLFFIAIPITSLAQANSSNTIKLANGSYFIEIITDDLNIVSKKTIKITAN